MVFFSSTHELDKSHGGLADQRDQLSSSSSSCGKINRRHELTSKCSLSFVCIFKKGFEKKVRKKKKKKKNKTREKIRWAS